MMSSSVLPCSSERFFCPGRTLLRCSASGRLSAHAARRPQEVSCRYRVTVLPGDGIGPEITKVAVNVLTAAAKAEKVEINFSYGLIGGAAIDAVGSPFPEETLKMCRLSAAVLLSAIGG